MYKCIGLNCNSLFEIRLEENVKVGESVFLKALISNFVDHDIINKPIRCTGFERENLKPKKAALGVSKVQAENILYNSSEPYSENCKSQKSFEKDILFSN